ncbi:MAG: multicopper oxidase domain-containing protein [Alphaproteobacteria bacterium]|nr:multicopper oxidase domain-containing protein [Alphaproteobacteria bacterium]
MSKAPRLVAQRTAAALAILGACASVAHADFDIPTGAPSSPLFGALPFSQEMPMFEEFGTKPVPTSNTCPTCVQLPQPTTCDGTPDTIALDNFLKQTIYPLPQRTANTSTQNPWASKIGSCVYPLAQSAAEGRPTGEWFSHQRWGEFTPKVFVQTAQIGARANRGLRDTVQRHTYSNGEFAPGGLYYRGGTTSGAQVRFHPNMPVQSPKSIWTFDGTMPPKLLVARYGEPIVFRHYNALPIDYAANNGFGAHTITTHLHNGHTPAESDGFTGAFYFPGQYYDYRWPMILAGHDSINTTATDPRAGFPNGAGGITRIRGDWRETMSTLWFHDHMVDYTAQNVYKGNAAVMNIFSAVDRGKEGYLCNYTNAANPNLCLPSGTSLDWGNRDYDVNLLVADKAWDASGQLYFNIFNLNGFLGDRATVNWAYKPYMNVRARRYRLRILNGSVSRLWKFTIVTANGTRVPFHMVANDGNIMEHSVPFPNAESQELPGQGIGERFDIVIDFKPFPVGTKLYLVNLMEHDDGRGPKEVVPLASVMNNSYNGDPVVGKIMEFRVAAYTGIDRSMNPADYVEGKKKMIPRPTFTAAELATARKRTFEFGRSGNTDSMPWTIKTDGGQGLGTDIHRIDAAPNKGDVEIWRVSTDGGWAHPVHIHFEEGQIIGRDGGAPKIWEKWARKDLYTIGNEAGLARTFDIALRFREFMGTYMEHCHNTQHEDHRMLLRWDIKNPGQTIAIPAPIPTWEGTTYEPSHDNSGPGSSLAGSP